MKCHLKTIKVDNSKSQTPQKHKKKHQSTDVKIKPQAHQDKKFTSVKFYPKQANNSHFQRSKKKNQHSKSKPKIKLSKYIQSKYSIQMAMQQQALNIEGPILTNWGINPHKNYIKIIKENYKYIRILGQGSVGIVWQVQQIKTGKKYAMKQISKAKAIAKRNIQFIMNQRQILPQIKNNFLVNFICSFQDQTHLYLIIDLLQGGNLRSLMNHKKTFSQQQVRFLIGCIFASLQYLSDQNIVHRDLKPENLIFDNKGYLNLIDMGLAKKLKEKQCFSGQISGTIGYIAPQIFKFQKFRFEVDYFSLGVITYELMKGCRPFNFNENEVQQLKKEFAIGEFSESVFIKKTNIPQGWSIQAIDFINKLLSVNPLKRLGFKGISQLKKHNWLKDFPWEFLYKKQLKSPFQNFSNEIKCSKIKKQDFLKQKFEDSSYLKSIKQNQELFNKGMLQQLFNGFTFHCPQHLIQNVSQHSKIIASTGPSYQIRKISK